MVKWFSVLKANDIEIKLSEPAEEEEVVTEPEVKATKEEVPAKPKKEKAVAAEESLL